MGEMLRRLMVHSKIGEKREHREMGRRGVAIPRTVQFNVQHLYISTTRAARFRTRFTIGKALQRWRRMGGRGQRQRLAECRAMVLWRLYRQKSAMRRYWVRFVLRARYKRSMLLKARQAYVQQQLVRPVCRDWTRLFAERKYGRTTRAERVQLLVRRIALHWLAKSKQVSSRRLSHIQRLCARHLGPNGTGPLPPAPTTAAAAAKGTIDSGSGSDRDGDPAPSPLVLTRPRGQIGRAHV